MNFDGWRNVFIWDGWFSAVLSFAAIVIGIRIAYLVLKQTEQIANEVTARDQEAYLTDRKQGVIDHARAIVLEARTILDLTNPRLAALLSLPADTPHDRAAKQATVRDRLTRLQVEVELLRVLAVTMPEIESKDTHGSATLRRLMDEGAWMYSEAVHSSILAFDLSGEDQEVDLAREQDVVDALLNGSFVNLPTRLLSDCIGTNPDQIPSLREAGSPWPRVYKAREALLMNGVIGGKSWRPGSLAEAAGWQLDHTINRFQDQLMQLLTEWDQSKIRAHRR